MEPINSGFSDRLLVQFNYKVSLQKAKVPPIAKQIWKKTNLKMLANEVKINLELNDNIKDPDEMGDLILEVLSSAAHQLRPIEKRSGKSLVFPFFDAELLLLKRKRRKWETTYRKQPSIENKIEFRRSVTECKLIFKEKKTVFYNGNLNRTFDIKKKFNNIRDLLGLKEAFIFPKNNNTDLEIANAFCSFYEQKVTNIKSEIPSKAGKLNIRPANNEAELSHFRTVTIEDAITAITTSSNSTCLLDDIPSFYLKSTSFAWKRFALNLVNRSLETGVYPEVLKIASINPKLKKQTLDPESLNGHRPFANTNTISKLPEQVAAVQLKLHLENEKLIDTYQSAYRALHSTETCLLKKTNEIFTHLDRDNLVIVLGLNLSAAFDTIDFHILDEIVVKRFSIKETCKKWILFYIQNRKQMIQIRKTMSRKSDVLYGVPQG